MYFEASDRSYSKQDAGDYLSALKHRAPWLRRKLPTADKCFTAWAKREPPTRVPPLPVSWVQAVAMTMIQRGYILFAMAVLVGFHAYLRPSEIYGLRWDDFLFGHGATNGVVRLCDTKTGKRNNASEFATITDPLLLWVLARLRGSQTGPLVSDPGVFRQQFQAALAELQLDAFEFEVRSLRRGGATHDYRTHGSFDVACDRGRWQDRKTCRIYIADALASLVALQLPPDALARLERVRALWAPFLAVL